MVLCPLLWNNWPQTCLLPRKYLCLGDGKCLFSPSIDEEDDSFEEPMETVVSRLLEVVESVKSAALDSLYYSVIKKVGEVDKLFRLTKGQL